MWQVFTPQSPYRKRARLAAILWTLLIFILCLWPASELPQTNVPLADKWTHFILFAVFSFCWLFVRPDAGIRHLLFVFIVSVVVGWLVEVLQLKLVALGRSFDYNDIIANGIGGLLGVLLFYILSRIAKRKINAV